LARENLAAAKAVAPAIELSLIRARNGLDVLLGRRPAASGPLPQTLAELPSLEPVNIGIPAALLDRRPDIIAAEMSLRAANERVGVSIAQLYPDLTLTADLGRSADAWSDIWKDETEIYSAVFRLAQPVFRGGQLRAQVDAAKARYAELAADYAAAVLKALQEVEDALIGEQILQERLEFVQLQFDQALAAERLSQQRYLRGLESILVVLESERRRRNAENALAILKGRIWTTRVNLFLALGGDWTAEQTTVNQRGI
jgi:outer membrane protein TolC